MNKIPGLTLCILLFSAVVLGQNKSALRDTTIAFKVFGVCEQCKHRIEGVLKVRGIESADWNIDTKILTITYAPSKISLEKINNKIAGEGHDTYYKKAKDVDYYALPKCCYYRQMNSMKDSAQSSSDKRSSFRGNQ